MSGKCENYENVEDEFVFFKLENTGVLLGGMNNMVKIVRNEGDDSDDHD